MREADAASADLYECLARLVFAGGTVCSAAHIGDLVVELGIRVARTTRESPIRF
jgi:hypothetical protein